MNSMSEITTTQAAGRLGITSRRINYLIRAGRLPAVRAGKRAWRIDERDLARVAHRPPGRPRTLPPGKTRTNR
jgi:excisionase family DNA binding protein